MLVSEKKDWQSKIIVIEFYVENLVVKNTLQERKYQQVDENLKNWRLHIVKKNFGIENWKVDFWLAIFIC